MKPYTYAIVTMRISERYPLASVISKLKSRGIEILHWDEMHRTIVVRASTRELAHVKSVAEAYATTATIEVKASIKLRTSYKNMRKAGITVEVHGGRLLGLADCGSFTLLLEYEKRVLRVKHCRKTSLTPPSMLPPSLCIYQLHEVDPLKLVEEARECLEHLAPKIAASESG